MNMYHQKFTTTTFNQPWITRKIKKLSKRNNRAMSKAQSAIDCDIYKRLKGELQKECRKTYENYIMNILCGDYGQNPKNFYGFISSKRNDK